MLRASLLALALLAAAPASAERIFSDGFEEPGSGGVDYCDDPLVMPAGFVFKSKVWSEAFSVPGQSNAVFPNSVGTPVPVPGYEWFRRFQQGQFQFYTKGQFVSIGFVMEPNLDISMTWDTVQSGPNYTSPRPADAMLFNISPCPWDARIGFLSPACGKVSGLDSMFASSKMGVNPTFVCPLTAGVTYYLNVLMHNPDNSFVHTCRDSSANSANGCDVQMRHSGTYGVLRWQRTDAWRN